MNLAKLTQMSLNLQFIIQNSIKISTHKHRFTKKSLMDKLKALREKLKKGQEEKQEEKIEQIPIAELGYTQNSVESSNQIQKHQMQQQEQGQQVQHFMQTKQSNQFGYQIKKQNLEDKNISEQVGQDQCQRYIQEPQQKIASIDSNYQYVQAKQTQNQTKYDHQKAEETPLIIINKQQYILQNVENNFGSFYEQKQVSPLPSCQFGQSKPQMATPVKQSVPQLMTPVFADEKKKSKMQMLREKIRLKKLAQIQSLSNKSIPEEPNIHQSKPSNFKFIQIPQPSQWPLNNTLSKPQQSTYQDVNQTEQTPLNNNNQKKPQNLGHKGILQYQENQQQENYGNKKPHINPVREALSFQGIRNDDKPELATAPHTLFYQLNQLQDYFKSKKEQKTYKNNSTIKEFVQQLIKLKQNIQHFNNA